jgi:hypothetical protein
MMDDEEEAKHKMLRKDQQYCEIMGKKNPLSFIKEGCD